MKVILEFLIRFCLPLFEKHGFRFSDSGIVGNHADGASVVLESKDAQICITHGRGEFVWYIRSLYDPNKKNWFSIYLVSQLLGRSTDTGLMDEANCDFLSRNTDEIIRLFREASAQDTIDKLRKLEVERARRM